VADNESRALFRMKIHPQTARPLLILDLDESLIFGTRDRLDRPFDAVLEPYAIYHRPGVAGFLDRVSTVYALAVWTSATHDYARVVVESVFPKDLELAFVWSRERCTWRRVLETQEEYWLKNLLKVRRLGFDLDRVLIVDDEPRKLERNYGNLVPIRPWIGDSGDQELSHLAGYLISIADRPNFRQFEKRSWREDGRR
jgi:TFIIF-interacting CTD phosphatase-like protein